MIIYFEFGCEMVRAYRPYDAPVLLYFIPPVESVLGKIVFNDDLNRK